jgi:hypothetical protein
VSRRDLPLLDDAVYDPSDVRALATGWGRSGAAAGALLAQWVATGSAPDVDDLLRLQLLGAPAWDQPNAAALDRLQAEPAVAALRLDRTQLATAFAVCGSAARAARALAELGTPDPERLTAWSQEQDAGATRQGRRTGVGAHA